MKKLMILLSLLGIALFVVSCGTGQATSRSQCLYTYQCSSVDKNKVLTVSNDYPVLIFDYLVQDTKEVNENGERIFLLLKSNTTDNKACFPPASIEEFTLKICEPKIITLNEYALSFKLVGFSENKNIPLVEVKSVQ